MPSASVHDGVIAKRYVGVNRGRWMVADGRKIPTFVPRNVSEGSRLLFEVKHSNDRRGAYVGRIHGAQPEVLLDEL